jgi:hypothetical protein
MVCFRYISVNKQHEGDKGDEDEDDDDDDDNNNNNNNNNAISSRLCLLTYSTY